MANFTLRQLEIFNLAAQYSSFSLVAKFLHMSKPAITKQIQALEHQLNVSLFKKHGRGIRLTPEAQRLLPQVRSILEQTAQMKKMIELGLDQSKPTLTFSTTNTYSGLLFTAMKKFNERHEVEYEVFVEPQDRGYKKIEQDKVDFLVTDEK